MKKNDTELSQIKADIDQIKTDVLEIKTLVKDFKKNLRGLIEIQQRLVHERLGTTVPISPKEYGEETSNKTKIEISNAGNDSIKVSGKTFDFKEAIKSSGAAKFDQGSKSWTLPLDCLDKLVKNFEAINLVKGTDFSVNVTVDESSKKTISDSEEEDGFGSGF